MKGREIFLLVLIIAVGVIFYHIQTGQWEMHGDWDEGFFFSYEEFTYEESEELNPPFPEKLQVINAHGSVEIQGTDENIIVVRLEKKIRRRKEEQADRIAKELHTVINRDDQQLTVSTNRDLFRGNRFKTDFKLTVPHTMKVHVKNSYGLVKTEQIADTNIINSNGQVIASDIDGYFMLKNTNKDIEVHNVRSDCRIESQLSSISIKGVQGNTLIANRHGEIEIQGLSGNTTVEGAHSQIIGQNITGPLEIESSYEKIVLRDVGPAIIRTKSSSIDIKGAQGDLEIDNRHSSVKMEEIRGNVHITGKSLDIFGVDIIGMEISISSENENIELIKFSGNTTLSLSHGDIHLVPLPLTHPIDVKGYYAEIKLLWPQGKKYPLEAQTKSGEIHWGLALKPSFHTSNSHSILKAFVEEKNNPPIRLSTSYRDIRIEE